MTAATQRRALTEWGDQVLPQSGRVKLAANAVVKKGYHLSISATGFADSFIAATALKSGGICLEDADNTGGADGAIEVDVELLPTDMVNGTAGDALADADAPCACYALDNQTVTKTSNNGARSIAGLFVGLNPETGAPRLIPGLVGWALAAALISDAGGASQLTAGTTTLIGGLKTVANAAVTATSKIIVSRKDANGSTALGLLEGGKTIVAGTSFTIAALKEADGTTQTNDVSKVDYVIVG